MDATYIIIDGIDECDFSERKAILSFMTSLVANSATPGKLRTLFVSQDENDIKKLLRSCTILRLTDDHNRSDIETYALKRSHEIQDKFQLLDETRHYIVKLVRDGSDGKSESLKLCSYSTNPSRHVSIRKVGFSQPTCSTEYRRFVQRT